MADKTIYIVVDTTCKPASSICGTYGTKELAKVAVYDAVSESIYGNRTIEDFTIIMELLFES
jgi:hypothetical protein